MKKSCILLFIILCTSFSHKTLYHQDFSVIKNYDNIKTRITTGYDYEEIKKIEFIGKYARDFAKKQNFKKPIFLDFNHFYTGYCDPDYFISVGNGRVYHSYDTDREPPLSSEGIVIRQVNRKFDIQETLHLLDYAISNQKLIKSKQKFMKYHKNYEKLHLTSMDTILINSLLSNKVSETVIRTLKKRIWRVSNKKEGVFLSKYFSRNNKYYIQYSVDRKLKELELDNVYDFQMVDKRSALLFDSKSTFYYLNNSIHNGLPKKIKISNIGSFYRPFKVQKIGSDKIAIYFRPGFDNTQRTLIYDIRTQKIIQDLDKVFKD